MQAVLAPSSSFVRCAQRPAAPRRSVAVVRAQGNAVQERVNATALATLAGALLAPNAMAATEAMQLAGSDSRAGILLTLILPVAGWVGFNIAGPAQRQLDNMAKKSVAGAVGLGAAALLASPSADAATEAMQLADSDNRLGTLAIVVVVALGWVLFNILGPASRQLESMTEKSSVSSKPSRPNKRK